MEPVKEKIAAFFTIYKGLPFYQKLLYQTPKGLAVDVTGWIGKLVVREEIESDDVLFTFSTDEGTLDLGNGTIELVGPDALASALLEWTQGVGHLVIGPDVNTVKPIALFGFNIQPCTTDVPTP